MRNYTNENEIHFFFVAAINQMQEKKKIFLAFKLHLWLMTFFSKAANERISQDEEMKRGRRKLFLKM